MEAATAIRPRPRLPRLRGRGDDEQLVARVRGGDEHAFAEVYERYHRPLLSFCRHMLGSREESEDAVQQAFLSAYRSLRSTEQPIDLKPWLYVIARNQCLKQIGRRRELPSEHPLEIPTEGLADEVERRADLRELLADVHRLPEDQRAALVLSQLGALDHEEIGEVIGVPASRVKALVFQARRSLIADRDARGIPCVKIREELAVASGAEFRRGPLVRHLDACPGCRAFHYDVRAQSKALAVLLPVVPTEALRRGVLLATGSGGAAGGGATGALTAVGAKAGLAAKALVVALVAGGGVAGTAAIVRHDRAAPARPAAAPAPARGAAPAGARAPTAAGRALPVAATRTVRAGTTSHQRRRHTGSHPKAVAGTRAAATTAATTAGATSDATAAATAPGRTVSATAPHGRALGHAKTTGATGAANPAGAAHGKAVRAHGAPAAKALHSQKVTKVKTTKAAPVHPATPATGEAPKGNGQGRGKALGQGKHQPASAAG